MSGRVCVFFDRDGVVNESPGPGYVDRSEDFRILPGLAEVLAVVARRGALAVIVSNQRGLALGTTPREELDKMHEALQAHLRAAGVPPFREIMVCPHERGTCDCRKPLPGMFHEAARRHGIDLSRSWMVGDRETDVEAGHNAGCRAILLAPEGTSTAAEHRVTSHAELCELLDRLLPDGA